MDWMQALADAIGHREQADSLALGEILIRTVLIYAGALAVIRLGEKRSFGRNTAFDLVMAIMIGSTVSRGITGNAPLFGSLAAGAGLVALHWVTAALSYRWGWFGTLAKGSPRELVRDGEVLEEAMHASHITREDLMESLRRSGLDEIDRVRSARMERDGSISVVPRSTPPTVTDVDVERSVQTVRIVLD